MENLAEKQAKVFININMVKIILSLQKVEYGKTNNWLKIYCYAPWLDNNRLFDFEYCGTELIKNNLIFTKKQEKELFKMLNKKFGMPPFSIDNAKEALDDDPCIELGIN